MNVEGRKDTAAIVLAGGRGTRLGDGLERKPARLLAGKPLVRWVVEACQPVADHGVAVVIPPLEEGGERIAERVGKDVVTVVQDVPMGTGHAFLAARHLFEKFEGNLIVTVGDAPALEREDLEALLEEHNRLGAVVTFATGAYTPTPPYGRVIRSEDGAVEALIEEKDTTPVQRSIREVVTSQWVFSSPLIWPLAMQFQRSPRSREMQLTDIVALARKAGLRVAGWQSPRPERLLGVNTPEEFDEMERYLLKRQDATKRIEVHEGADATSSR